MGQLAFYDEEECGVDLSTLKAWAERGLELENRMSKMRELLFPNINIWAECGTVMDVNDVFWEEFLKYKWKKKKNWLEIFQ